MTRLKMWARRLKGEVLLLWLAARDSRTPWAARLLAGLVAAYAFSPIDFIPDAIPVLGLLDDLLIVPAGAWLALRLIPPDLKAELRAEAAARSERPTSRLGMALVLVVWAAMLAVGWWWWGQS